MLAPGCLRAAWGMFCHMSVDDHHKHEKSPGKPPALLRCNCPVMILVVLALSVVPVLAAKVNIGDRSTWRSYKTAVDGGPQVEVAVHNVGEVWMTVSNIGQFGTGYLGPSVDPITGLETPSCVFPGNSNLNYLYVGAFWIGAVVGRDTLVSIGVDDYYNVIELWPDTWRGIERRSIRPSSAFFSEQARSEQDFIAVYADTLRNPSYVAIDATDGRPHTPLNIEITQRSYAWSYSYARDFILFDYSIRNIGFRTLSDVYMGIYVDGDVHHSSLFGELGYGEDICGFRRDFPSGSPCGFKDTINLAYITDNDGDPSDLGDFTKSSARGAAGVRVVRTPSDSLKYSFNWWVTNYEDASLDFGPRRVGTADDPFRDMDGILGTPMGDKNKYYIMRHREFDYDQLFTAVDHTAEGWLPGPSYKEDVADGFDARYLLSFGPFDIYPGEVLPVTFAWVLGDRVHRYPNDFEQLFNPNNPEIYYETLDFSDVAINSKWASWIYDNPGYDTDGNGYLGKYRICSLESTLVIDSNLVPWESTWVSTRADTSYYEGDGVPDFRAAAPPTPPVLEVLPRLTETATGELVIRWNGLVTETEKDVFSGRRDFEGYRVYQSLTSQSADYVLMASYDLEDYNRWTWSPTWEEWLLREPPFTLDSLRSLYGDDFRPLHHDIDNPLYVANPEGADSAFYFSRQDWNTGDLHDTLGIHKRFPEEPYPTTLDVDSASIYYPEELTREGRFKYFEYQYVLRNLLPSRLYYVTVTSFDYGSPGQGLEALESSPGINSVAAYPQNPARLVEENGLKVVVYPNPYRLDANYRARGFEGLDREDLPNDRVRAIHFTNLPHRCTIRIFSLDGDLIRELHHDYPPDHPQAMHETWDLITRNTQAVVSGIYYYSVESEWGNQLGKLVIIM